MTTKKIGRITSILLLLIMLLQFVPAVSAAFSGKLEHNRVQFLLSSQKLDNVIANTENGKFTFKPPISKVQLLFHAQTLQSFQTEQRLLRREVVFDYRQSIQCRISEYFFGSKYRDGSLFI